MSAESAFGRLMLYCDGGTPYANGADSEREHLRTDVIKLNDARNELAGALTVEREKLSDYEDKTDWHGCSTGDCQHERAQQCADALSRALARSTSECARLTEALAAEQEERQKLEAKARAYCDELKGKLEDAEAEFCEMRARAVSAEQQLAELLPPVRNPFRNE